MEFRYTANTFVEAEKTRFRYRLEGLETEWHDAGTRRAAYYSNLSPGHYRFQVLAGNHQNVWNQRGAALAMELVPFYYQTWSFRIGAAVASSTLLFAVFSWRLSELRKIGRLERDSALALERSRLAEDLHDGLGSDLTQLRLLAALAERDLPRRELLEAHLRKIAMLTNQVARDLRDIIWLAHPASDTLESLSLRVCALATQLFEGHSVQCAFELSPLPPLRIGLGASQNIYLAAKEALNNVLRHAAARKVCIRTEVRDGEFRLIIQDDGLGFDLTQPPVQPDRRLGGQGLVNMRKRIGAFGGGFAITSKPGSGTEILMTHSLPCR